MPIYKRSDSWWIDIRHNGRRIRRSAHTTDKAAAQELHDQIKASLWRDRELGESAQTWNDAVKRWLLEHQDKKSLADDKYRLRWLSRNLAGIRLRDITRDGIEDLIAKRLAEPAHGNRYAIPRPTSPATVNRHMAALSAVLNCAVTWGWIDSVPPIRKLKEAKIRVVYLTREQLVALVAELPLHLAEIACFAVACGLRGGNVRELEWSQVNIPGRCAWIHADQAKGGKPIPVPLNDEAMAVLAMRQGHDARYVFTYDGHTITKLATAAWHKATKRAGLEGFRPHDLRHTWASWHAMAGTPMNVLQALGGWSGPQMVQRYAHLAPGYLSQYAGHARPISHNLATDSTTQTSNGHKKAS